MGRAITHLPRAEVRAALLAVGVGIVLLIVKFGGYALTGSAAIFSDALEGIVNIAAAGFALYAIVLAHRPADAEHPYGHGKVEFLSAGFEGGMVLVAALVIVVRAVESIVMGPVVERIDAGMLLMMAAMLVNGALGLWLIRSGRRAGSPALEADGKHLFSDAITSVGVLIGLIGIRVTGWALIDPIVALLVAVYIAWIAVGLLRSSAAGLMDQQDRHDDALLRDILDSHLGPAGKEPRICSYHKLRHRHSGRYHWVDFHIMLPATQTIDQGHAVASAIEYEIEQALREGNATAHIEPCAETPCANCASPIPPR
jgi:cation diffusion facilitator family transporter